MMVRITDGGKEGVPEKGVGLFWVLMVVGFDLGQYYGEI